MRFADIIGHDDLKRHLVRSVDEGRVSHAQLFTGEAGYGALPLAVAYAQYVNCPNRSGGDSCGVCPSCVQTAQMAHPDVHMVFPVNKREKKSGEAVLSDQFLPLWREIWQSSGGYFSSQQWFDKLDLGKTMKGLITAKESDEIIRKLSFKSFSSEYKVMIVWLPELMNGEAANKILKILEEPWEKTLFLLVAERPELLLPTIVSRTQQVSVGRIATEALESVAAAGGVTDRATAHGMARLAGGDMLELRSLMRGETDAMRRECFELFCSLMRLSYNDKHLELMSWADDVSDLSREGQRAFLSNAARLLRESYMIHAGASSISYLWGEEADFCRKFAPYIGNSNIEFLIGEIETAMAQISQNGSPRIVFTHFALAVSKTINRL
ncbi:MAG: DNA polymerase III subunit delta [Alistipes sp.]|nr:DNA polymerase III subunit delta [Alistipes sp.]